MKSYTKLILFTVIMLLSSLLTFVQQGITGYVFNFLNLGLTGANISTIAEGNAESLNPELASSVYSIKLIHKANNNMSVHDYKLIIIN